MLVRWLSTIIGVALSTLGMFLSSIGNLLMRRAQLVSESNPTEKAKPFYCRPVWYVITLFLIGNGCTDFAAFQFASMDVLAPLSAVATAVNFLVAFFLLGEIFAWNHALGGMIMVVAAATAIWAGPPEPETNASVLALKSLFVRKTYIAFFVVKILVLLLCVVVINLLKRNFGQGNVEADAVRVGPDSATAEPVELKVTSELKNNDKASNQVAAAPPPVKQRSFLETVKLQTLVVAWACLASGVGSWTNLLGKMVTKLVAASTYGENQMHDWATWLLFLVLISVAALQFKVQAMMMIAFPAVQIMPTFNCFFILHMIFEGGFFFREFEHFESPLKTAVFGIAVPICIVGIAVASHVPNVQKMRENQPEVGLEGGEVDADDRKSSSEHQDHQFDVENSTSRREV